VNQELLDLLLGELPDGEAEALRTRLDADPELQREYADLSKVFALMSRGERVEPSAEGHRQLMAEARRLTRPSLSQRLRAVGGLVRFRLRHSLGFRIAVVSLAIHFAVLTLLYHYKIVRSGHEEGPDVHIVADQRPVEPAPSFRASLAHRRLSHGPRLARYGIENQRELIENTLETLQSAQASDGSFGSIDQTGKAALALLAEGDGSVSVTPRGQAVRRTMRFIRNEVHGGKVDGFALSALIEDYSLSYDHLSFEERVEYFSLIRRLILTVGTDAASCEALALARKAGFAVPAGIELGEAECLISDRPAALLDRPATRLSATAVLARGQVFPSRERIRAWLRPLFETARDHGIEQDPAEALLTLQAPYRL